MIAMQKSPSSRFLRSSWLTDAGMRCQRLIMIMPLPKRSRILETLIGQARTYVSIAVVVRSHHVRAHKDFAAIRAPVVPILREPSVS